MPMTEVIKIITAIDTMTASGRLKLQGTLERKKSHRSQGDEPSFFICRTELFGPGELQKTDSLKRDYLELSPWSSARTAPVESVSVVEVSGALMVAVSGGWDWLWWPETSVKCRNIIILSYLHPVKLWWGIASVIVQMRSYCVIHIRWHQWRS